MPLLALLLAAALALIHLFAGKLRFLGVIPRSRWLSFASGISVAYVFVHLLPELAEGQRTLEDAGVTEAVGEAVVAIEAHVWVVALVGLAVFYGLERAAKASREEQEAETGDDETEPAVFWLHMGSYGLYNVLIGYLLLHRETPGTTALLLFWFAMALHFFVNDYGLRQHHRTQYGRTGRWVLAAAVVGGCLLGFLAEVSEAAIAALIAFLGGGVVLNVLKEELPEERQSRFWPFAAGAGAYAALLLAV